MTQKKKLVKSDIKLTGPLCCICGRSYNPDERVRNYFQYLDLENIEVLTCDILKKDGQTLALCPTCFKAAGFGYLELTEQKPERRYQYYRPDLKAPMFEEDQEREIAKNTPF